MGNLMVVDDPPARPSHRTEGVNPERESQNGEDDEAEGKRWPTALHGAVSATYSLD
jgi:hypothetical protein